MSIIDHCKKESAHWTCPFSREGRCSCICMWAVLSPSALKSPRNILSCPSRSLAIIQTQSFLIVTAYASVTSVKTISIGNLPRNGCQRWKVAFLNVFKQRTKNTSNASGYNLFIERHQHCLTESQVCNVPELQQAPMPLASI